MTDQYEKLAKCMECTPEEIPALIQKHFPWNGREACDCVLESQKEHEELSEARLAALLDAERENTALRQQVAELHSHGVSLHKAAAGRDMEREAVVAWLRAGASNHQGFGVRLIGDELNAYADHIERGAHRREEEK
jgi:hypothetical protein